MKKNKHLTGFLILGLTIPQFNIPRAYANTYTTLSNKTTTDSFQSDLVNDGNLMYPTKVFDILSTSEKTVFDYTQNGDLSLLKKSIDLFTSTTTLLYCEEGEDIFEDDNFKTVFFKIRDEIYKIDDIDTQSALITYYGEQIFIGWRKNKTLVSFKDFFLRLELVDYNKDKNIKAQPRLEYLEKLVIYLNGNPDLDSESNEIPDENNYPPKQDDDSVSNDENINNDNNNNNTNDDIDINVPSDDDFNNNNDNNSQSDSFFTEYIKKDNSCVEKVTFYKNGVAISYSEYPISKNDYIKCGIYDYVHSDIFNVSTIIDNEYINNNQNIESEYTIHFTTNKSSKNPTYFNTGIKVDSSNLSANYNQLKDALYQLSIKSNGFSVTDNNKFLVILNGRPLVLNKKIETYSKSQIEKLLNLYVNVDLKILKPSENNPNSLEGLLSDKKINSFLLNGNTIKLDNSFILNDKELYGPVEELLNKLEITTNFKDLTLYMNNNVKNITITSGSKKYYVDNNEKLFSSSPIMYNSIIYSSLNSLLSEFGYDIIWDDESNELIILNKE